jgi:hypothetical protein
MTISHRRKGLATTRSNFFFPRSNLLTAVSCSRPPAAVSATESSIIVTVAVDNFHHVRVIKRTSETRLMRNVTAAATTAAANSFPSNA